MNTPEPLFNGMKNPTQFRWILVLGVLLLNLLAITLTVIELVENRQDRERSALTATQNLSQSLDREIASSFDKIDLGLQNIAETHTRMVTRGHFDIEAWDTALLHQRARHAILNGLRATDRAGNALYGLDASSTKGARIDDRDYFIRLRDHPDAGLVISPPVLGRTTGVWVIVLARRLTAPDGTFAGVTYATVPLDQFRQLFASIKLNRLDSITLRDDSRCCWRASRSLAAPERSGVHRCRQITGSRWRTVRSTAVIAPA